VGSSWTIFQRRARRTGWRSALAAAWQRVVYQPTESSGSYPLCSTSPDRWGVDAPLVRDGPLLSVIMPVFNTPLQMLAQAIGSVLAQSYSNWELIIVDDLSSDPRVLEQLRREYLSDRRIELVVRSSNGNISEAINSGLARCRGEFYLVLDHDDALHSTALQHCAAVIQSVPEVDYIYSDEDKLSADGLSRFGPFFKPDWSPEYMLAMMYTCHLSAFRTSMARVLGGYRSEFDGAQDFEFTLRFVRSARRVIHIPRLLYHWRAWSGSTAQALESKPLAEARARQAVAEHLAAMGQPFSLKAHAVPGHHHVEFHPAAQSRVSIVIPTANGTLQQGHIEEKNLDAVLSSIMKESSYSNLEIVVVHNGDLAPEQVSFCLSNRVVLVEYRGVPFNLADKINQGVASSSGDYVVLLNDDIRVKSRNWIECMLGFCQLAGVGAVGPKLLFPDGSIQHAGVVILSGCPGHAYYGWPGDSMGYALGAGVSRNYIAVTGACLMTPRRVFDCVGGFDRRFALNYNDVDYCLRIRDLGFRSVYAANVELIHFEGVSKDGGRSVLPGELELFRDIWGDRYPVDPYYNPNLSQTVPYELRT
jgi:glycosyltransferase involved in cell wall biosynthesis